MISYQITTSDPAEALAWNLKDRSRRASNSLFRLTETSEYMRLMDISEAKVKAERWRRNGNKMFFRLGEAK